LARASRCQREGRQFESGIPLQQKSDVTARWQRIFCFGDGCTVREKWLSLSSEPVREKYQEDIFPRGKAEPLGRGHEARGNLVSRSNKNPMSPLGGSGFFALGMDAQYGRFGFRSQASQFEKNIRKIFFHEAKPSPWAEGMKARGNLVSRSKIKKLHSTGVAAFLFFVAVPVAEKLLSLQASQFEKNIRKIFFHEAKPSPWAEGMKTRGNLVSTSILPECFL
jgi:hypothetical protein